MRATTVRSNPMQVRTSVLGNIGILTFRVHNFLATEVEPPTLKLRLVLDAGPDEGAISFLGVDATSLNVVHVDDVVG
jgi:hypothetical protein